MKFTPLATFALASALIATAASAQDFSDAELMSRLLKQKEAVSEARNGNLGATRSLTRGVELVTIEDIAPDAATAGTSMTPVATETDGGVTVAATDDPVSRPSDPNQPLVHVNFPVEEQINIRIQFGFDSAAIDRTQLPQLQQMCRVMHSTPEIELFRIVGHTDASGTAEYNERLSRLRAEEVARFLAEDCGIAASRLDPVGFGERFLFDAARPDADENRRVEFQALS